MGLYYKFDVLGKLKSEGYSSYRLRAEKLFSESTIQLLRQGEIVAISSIETICRLLNCQPGDILGYKEE